MGADDDVDFTFFQGFKNDFLLPGRNKAREIFDENRVVTEALGKGEKMLLTENGGGDQDGDLFAIHDGFEGGAHGNFSFAETDITTDEAIHRTLGCHIMEGAVNGGELVVGFGIWEGFCKVMHGLLAIEISKAFC